MKTKWKGPFRIAWSPGMSEGESGLNNPNPTYCCFSRVKPSEEVISVWAQARKITDEDQSQDWKKIVVSSEVKAYTDHPAARCFKAPLADAEAPELKYKDKKDNEKKVSDTFFTLGLLCLFCFQATMLQTMTGAAGHMASELLVEADEETAKITATISEFEEPNIEMMDPRKDAAEVLAAIRGKIVKLIKISDVYICLIIQTMSSFHGVVKLAALQRCWAPPTTLSPCLEEPHTWR